MNEKLRQQIDEWTGTDEHQKIVDLIEGLPAGERDAEAIGLLARAYNNLGSYAKALERLETTRAEGVDEANWHYRYGYALYFLDREREALRYFERVHELTPDDEDAVEFISECHVRVPFCRRVAEFWQWFTDNEPRLSAITESRECRGRAAGRRCALQPRGRPRVHLLGRGASSALLPLPLRGGEDA